ncbi:MAG: hypothetical protein HOO96_19710 [Polyangiaceae bacterium]|jgi:hypothetical protein|nr:hypothetical protein [Polyangiaceae bacterium]
MMNRGRRNTEATERLAAKRAREDQAPRLSAEVPKLATLALEVREFMAAVPVAEPGHVRRVVVESAPALFEMPCGDPRCKDGGHDVTREIIRALERGEARFEGDDACRGGIGTANCTRVMHYIGTATFK